MVATVACALAACGSGSDRPSADPDDSEAPPFQVRDSAGIRIIENQSPAEGSRLAWRIGPEPALTIGSVEGTGGFQFHLVDDAVKLGDGRLVVANGGSHQLLIFDGDGSYLTAWGQKGEGPGDFGGTHGSDAFGSRLFSTEPWPGDSIAVCHGTPSIGMAVGLELLSVRDREGRHARTVNLARAAPQPDSEDSLRPIQCRDILRNGSIVASRSSRAWARDPSTGIHRSNEEFFLLDSEGSVLAELGSHPGAEEFYYRDTSTFPPTSFWMFDPPFQQSVVWGGWGELAIVAPTDRYEIRAYGTDGAPVRIVRRDHDPGAPSPGNLDYLLGKVRDELRVEFVQLWPLDRSGGQAVAGSASATGQSSRSPAASPRSAT